MSANTRYLLRLWARVLVRAVPLGLLFAISLAYGNVWPVLFATLSSALAFVVLLRFGYGDRLIRGKLLADSPKPLIDWYFRHIRPASFPNGDATLAFGCATAYALYADYPAARAAVAGVTWDGRPPVIAAFRPISEALLCYFDTRDYERGLALATSAAQMASVNPAFPGARRLVNTTESYVMIGQVLCGHATDETVSSLEQKFQAMPTYDRLPVAWGLAIAYRKRGDAARTDEMLTYLRKVAPHCRALALPETPLTSAR